MTWIEWLDKLDKVAFILIHNDSDHYIFDNFFLVIRNALTWIPVYITILIFAMQKFRKSALLFIIFSVVTFALCDRLSSGLLKPLFERPRPCYDPMIQPFLRNLIECGGRYSFPSSHAANHFGLASFWYWTILYNIGKKWKWLWLWASIVGYAQIYVGKHYPLDIAGGALLGIVLGTSMAWIFENWQSLKAAVINTFKPAIIENIKKLNSQ
jgi:membrane-associated phospholipid phosphatase